jgi:hypothetical protein
MSKKTFTIFILFLLAIIAFLAWFFFFRSTTTPATPNDQGQGTDLFPFPVGTSTKPGPKPVVTGTSTGGTSTAIKERLPRLRQLWKDPTAGDTFFPGSGSTTAVRFVDRATGRIYESPLETLGNAKISNTTIPQVHEAIWAANGNELVFRYLKDDITIQSFYGIMATTSSSTALTFEGYFLPEDIRDVYAAGNKILYFDPTIDTGSLIQANINGTAKKAVMNSEARDWSLSYTNQKTAFLQTRPSGEMRGFGYALDLATGATTKIASDINGLTGTINPAGDRAFMSARETSTIISASYDFKTKATKTLSTRTLSEKCAWSNTKSSIIYCAVPISIPSGVYPDDWYKGKTSFSDTLLSINLATGETSTVLDPGFDASQNMDMMKMVVSRDDSYLTFINKKDMSLWLYRLTDN